MVPLQDTTGRTLEPVPPVSRPAWDKNSWRRSILSKEPLNFDRQTGGHGDFPHCRTGSAAWAMARLSSAVIFPFLGDHPGVKPVLSPFIKQKASAFTRVTSAQGQGCLRILP